MSAFVISGEDTPAGVEYDDLEAGLYIDRDGDLVIVATDYVGSGEYTRSVIAITKGAGTLVHLTREACYGPYVRIAKDREVTITVSNF